MVGVAFLALVLIMTGKSLLVVGAGATGSITACLLSRSRSDVVTTVWDKARGVGGRMTTHRRGSHSPQHNLQHVDMGAQYITRYRDKDVTSHVAALKGQLFEELQKKGVLVPFSGGIEGGMAGADERNIVGHYVSPQGISEVPRYFLEQAQASIHLKSQLTQLDIDQSTGTGTCWTSDGEVAHFAAVVLTIPVPQMLNIRGNLLDCIDPAVRTALESVQYSSRYALGLFFDDQSLPQVTWAAKYFDNPVLRFACWDTLKRGSPGYTNSSLLLHSSVPFALEHLEEDKTIVQETMLTAARELIPSLPIPSHTYMIRWRYSQVYKGYPGSPGCVVLCTYPLVVATGDAMIHSNLEGCMEAASITVRTITEHLTS